jgi:hypothetical protein
MAVDERKRRRTWLAATQQAAGKGRKDVISGPIAQGHMPALPEGRDVGASVRLVEVLRQANTE